MGCLQSREPRGAVCTWKASSTAPSLAIGTAATPTWATSPWFTSWWGTTSTIPIGRASNAAVPPYRLERAATRSRIAATSSGVRCRGGSVASRLGARIVRRGHGRSARRRTLPCCTNASLIRAGCLAYQRGVLAKHEASRRPHVGDLACEHGGWQLLRRAALVRSTARLVLAYRWKLGRTPRHKPTTSTTTHPDLRKNLTASL